MKGLGTDEAALIEVLCNRDLEDIQQIRHHFEQHHGDLHKAIHSETSGHFREVLLGLLIPRVDYQAHLLRDAIKGLGTADHVLIDVITQQPPHILHEIKEAYQRLFERDLEADIKGDTSFNYEQTLLHLLAPSRDSWDSPVDDALAASDAQLIYEKGEKRWGTDDVAFIDVFTRRSRAQLLQTDQHFTRKYEHGLKTTIKKETSGHYQTTLEALVDAPNFYYARRFRDAIEGLGTKDHQLCYLTVMLHRSERRDVVHAYNEIFNRDLLHDIAGDTSGDYKNAVLTLFK